MNPEPSDPNTHTDRQLPRIDTSLDHDQVYGRLLKLSKQGKLAGFRHEKGSDDAVVDAHGNPFDSDLLIHHTGHSLEFVMKMRAKLPIVFAILLVLTVCPGLPLTDSYLLTFGWYERLVSGWLETWMWYLPMTVLPIPFVWRTSMMKSVRTTHEHALETIEKIRITLSA